jgi:hypothetical protein
LIGTHLIPHAIDRGDRLVLLEELRVGDQIHVQAFEVAGAGAEQAAQ